LINYRQTKSLPFVWKILHRCPNLPPTRVSGQCRPGEVVLVDVPQVAPHLHRYQSITKIVAGGNLEAGLLMIPDVQAHWTATTARDVADGVVPPPTPSLSSS